MDKVDWTKWLTKEERACFEFAHRQHLRADSRPITELNYQFANAYRCLAALREENIEIKADRDALKLVLDLRTIEHDQDHEEVDKLEASLAALRALVEEKDKALSQWRLGEGAQLITVSKALALTEADMLKRLEMK